VNIDTLLVADYANIAEGGKLNVMGIFREIRAKKFPIPHPEMFLIIGMNASPAEYNKKRNITVKLINADATQDLVSVSHNIDVPQGRGGRKVEINHILRLQGVIFPYPGTYQFSVLVDNDEKGAISIELIEIPKSK
jgi:hypothetical protein